VRFGSPIPIQDRIGEREDRGLLVNDEGLENPY
jgi:hypothetical protein